MPMKKTLPFFRRLALPLVVVATLTFTIEHHFLSSEPSLPEHKSTTVSANPEEQTILQGDRKSTRLNSSHVSISYAVFCLKKKNKALSNEFAFNHNHDSCRQIASC